MKATTPSLCYLCGKPLTAPTNVDHLPPKQLYAKEVRKAHPTKLLTIEVHEACNKSFQHDEDYFVNSMAPFARGSYAGDALLREIFAKYKKGEKQGLVRKVLNEFGHTTPGGIALPPGRVARRWEAKRVHRVLWKIVRGLYFHETGQVLAEDTPNHWEVFTPDKPPSKVFLDALHDVRGRGTHPGVFDYKSIPVPELNNFQYWGLLFWDRLIITMAFHHPDCTCEQSAA